MRKLSVTTAILILALLLGLAFAAGVPAQAPDEKAQPVEDLKKEALPPEGGVPEVPCGPIEGPISCGDTIHVDTNDNINTMDLYSCSAWDESGPEEVYELTLPAGDFWDVEVSMENATVDLDIFVLDGVCDSDNCLAYGSLSAEFLGVGEATYWISVDGYNGAVGEADVTVTCSEAQPPPDPAPNDECGDATVIDALPFSDWVNTEGATTAPDDPIITCGGNQQHSNTVWYAYTADQDGLVDLGTCDTSYDTVLAVFEGTCGAFTELACNDDSCGVQSEIYDFPVTAGNTYYIEVADYGSAGGGDLNFYMSMQGGPDIWVNPEFFDQTLCVDEATTEILSICNDGNTPLDWTLVEVPDGGGLLVDQVEDGSFEAGTPNPFWAEYSFNFGTPLCDLTSCGDGTGTGPRTGDWWAWFGGVTDAYEEGSVDQDVTIPAGSATLSFWLEQIVCDDPVGYMEILVDGTQVFYVDGTSPLCGILGYSYQEVDVSAWADDGVHNIAFHSEIFTANNNFFVDDVVLDAGEEPDIPWMSVEPTEGTVDPGTCEEVNVHISAVGLTPDTYYGELLVLSNDPDEPEVVVPVSLTVDECGGQTMHVERISGFVWDGQRLIMKVLVADHDNLPLTGVTVDTSITTPTFDWARWRVTNILGWARFWAPLTMGGGYDLCVDDLTLDGYTYAPGDNVITCESWDWVP